MLHETYFRRIGGTLLGVLFGLSYGLVSETINTLLLPGIPIYQPLSLQQIITQWLLIGGALGLICSWSSESVLGVIASSVVGGLALFGVTFSTGEQSTVAYVTRFFAIIYLFLPIAAMLIPFMGFLRWTINKLEIWRYDQGKVWKRFALSLGGLAVFGLIGSLSAFPSYGRTMVIRTHQMIQEGLSGGAIPQPLRSYQVGDFLQNAQGSYTMEWSDEGIEQIPVARPTTERSWEESAVIARFENGWMLMCIYSNADANPVCVGLGR